MAACSSATRIVGCILVFALVVQLYIDIEGNKISLGCIKDFVVTMFKNPGKIFAVLICPFGAFSYMTFLNFFCGDAWAYKNVQIADFNRFLFFSRVNLLNRFIKSSICTRSFFNCFFRINSFFDVIHHFS